MAAEVILYIGDSGSGKSTALRNLDPKETVIITPNSKSLPFPKGHEYKVVEKLFKDGMISALPYFNLLLLSKVYGEKIY